MTRSSSPITSSRAVPKEKETNRRSFVGPYSRPNSINSSRRFEPPNTPANSPCDFGRCSVGKADCCSKNYDEKENSVKHIMSPAKNCKNFMSPTISAASKFTPSPRKKVLSERNDPIRSSILLSDGKAMFFSSNVCHDSESKPENDSSMVFPNDAVNSNNNTAVCDEVVQLCSSKSSKKVTFSDFRSSVFTDIAPLDADPSLPPYDPKKNYLSPRPRFLHYKPNPRIGILVNREENGLESSDCFQQFEDNLMPEILSDTFSDSEGTEEEELEAITPYDMVIGVDEKVSSTHDSEKILIEEEKEAEEDSHVSEDETMVSEDKAEEESQVSEDETMVSEDKAEEESHVSEDETMISEDKAEEESHISEDDETMVSEDKAEEESHVSDKNHEKKSRGFSKSMCFVMLLTLLAAVFTFYPEELTFASHVNHLLNELQQSGIQCKNISELPKNMWYLEYDQLENEEWDAVSVHVHDFVSETAIATRNSAEPDDVLVSQVTITTTRNSVPISESTVVFETNVANPDPAYLPGPELDLETPIALPDRDEPDNALATHDSLSLSEEGATFETNVAILDPALLLTEPDDLSVTQVTATTTTNDSVSVSESMVAVLETEGIIPDLASVPQHDTKQESTYVTEKAEESQIVNSNSIAVQKDEFIQSLQENSGAKYHVIQVSSILAALMAVAFFFMYQYKRIPISTTKMTESSYIKKDMNEGGEVQSSERRSLTSSLVSTDSSPSYGSFTTFEKIPIKNGNGEEEEIVTPVRRSSRIRSHQMSSPLMVRHLQM